MGRKGTVMQIVALLLHTVLLLFEKLYNLTLGLGIRSWNQVKQIKELPTRHEWQLTQYLQESCSSDYTLRPLDFSVIYKSRTADRLARGPKQFRTFCEWILCNAVPAAPLHQTGKIQSAELAPPLVYVYLFVNETHVSRKGVCQKRRSLASSNK